MTNLIINIYDFFKKRPAFGWILFIVLTGALSLSVLTLNYKEDISDFLPLDENNQTALAAYQDISGANKIYAIVSAKDTSDVNQDLLVSGIDSLVKNIKEADSLHLVSNITTQVDLEMMEQTIAEVYDNIPIFLTDEDYTHIEALLSDSSYIQNKVADDKKSLLFPTSNLIATTIAKDPLSLFSPVLKRLTQNGITVDYELYDDYIMTPDGTKAIAIISSAFGANESDNNTKLLELLDTAVLNTLSKNSDIDIHVIGGPAIAVSNANQIKTDSFLAICIAVILISLLLICVFKSARNIILIAISVAWGWLFAVGIIAVFYDSISIIVIGIASVILGIALNYPLHLVDHLKCCTNQRSALKEVVSPLIIGNITTVGAFLCLVPLNSTALHDLGLFCALLLIGTIIFVLIFLPHAIKIKYSETTAPKFITRISSASLDNKKWIIWSIVSLTVVFGYFSFDTEFDSDLRHINYLTNDQKADLDFFAKVLKKDTTTETVYVVSSSTDWETSLTQNMLIDKTIRDLTKDSLVIRGNESSKFLIPQNVQRDRLNQWNSFVAKYQDFILSKLERTADAEGFHRDAFIDFYKLLSKTYDVKDLSELKALTNFIYSGNISQDKNSGRKSIVQTLTVKKHNVELVKSLLLDNHKFDGVIFDVNSMNKSITSTLSDNFNFIGIACGCIVFLFLWFSFGRLELAIISFIPMAVSWLWILGLMSLFGIKFNIVNIILATFIFGQGDDYTIFITEGLSYEYGHQKKLLMSYKNSIVLSALIMFIGIGTLIFAKHPALKSLGEVTVVGMISVVLMAYVFPPLIFNWLTKYKGITRPRPLTIKKLLSCAFYRNKSKCHYLADTTNLSVSSLRHIIFDKYRYKGRDIEKQAKKMLSLIILRQHLLTDLSAQDTIIVIDKSGQGELALMLSAMYPNKKIYVTILCDENREIFVGCIDDNVKNIELINDDCISDYCSQTDNIFVISRDIEKTSMF